MKRLLQPIALLLIGLVAMQPGLAGLLCAAPAAPCPMAISDIGPSCGGLVHAESRGATTAKVHGVPRSIASAALPATRKVLALAAPDASVETLPELPAVKLASAAAPAQAKSPPIYLRNRVFRI